MKDEKPMIPFTSPLSSSVTINIPPSRLCILLRFVQPYFPQIVSGQIRVFLLLSLSFQTSSEVQLQGGNEAADGESDIEAYACPTHVS